MTNFEVKKLLGKDRIEDLDKFVVHIGKLDTDQQRHGDIKTRKWWRELISK